MQACRDEAAAVFGSVSFQSEYNRERLRRTDAALPEPMYDGWYAFASWFPIGEHRPEDRTKGSFGRIMPRRGKGALEVTARYSTMDRRRDRRQGERHPDRRQLVRERQHPVAGRDWAAGASGIRFRQGYLSTANGRTVRVRTEGPRAVLTVKGLTTGGARREYEYEISPVMAAMPGAVVALARGSGCCAGSQDRPEGRSRRRCRAMAWWVASA